MQIEKMTTSTTVTYSQFQIPKGTIVQLDATVLTNIQICKDFVWRGDLGDTWRDQWYGDGDDGGGNLTHVTRFWSSDADGATLNNFGWTAYSTTNEPTLNKVDNDQGLRGMEFLADDQDDYFVVDLGGYVDRRGNYLQKALPGGVQMAVVVDHKDSDATKLLQYQVVKSARGDTSNLQYDDGSDGWTDTVTWNDVTGSATYAQFAGGWKTATAAGEVGAYTYELRFRPKANYAAEDFKIEHISCVWEMGDLQGFPIGSVDGTVGYPGYVFEMPFDGRIAADAGGAGILYISELLRR
jgi:hypothetical protein